MKITEFLDSKANINPFLRQILPPTYTINFAKGNTTILPECSLQIANSEHYSE
jgi:hypothetical protein